MFDISWVELLFVGMLALVIIGPKDLPLVFRSAAKFVAKGKRMLNDVKGSMAQLEKEVNIEAGKVVNDNDWRDLLPEEIRNLPDDFIPGSMTAEEHETRREELNKARKNVVSPQSTMSNTASDERDIRDKKLLQSDLKSGHPATIEKGEKKHG
jgi:sec-independent protein translocase protein TatB